MPRRLRNRVKFRLERLLLRGTHYRLLIIAALIGLISVIGGAVAHGAGGGFGGLGEAVWWAFLRLTDPGYLGDDVGTLRRTVSTVLTVLGYVVFLGALIAIMTQWLNETLRRLESGLTPIVVADHVLILGWAESTPTIVHELLQSEGRIHRFLRRRRTRALRIVILADEVTLEQWQELRDRLGPLFDERQIILRTGSPLRIEHLRRVAYLDAAVIVLPAGEPEPGQADPDTRTVKTLLSISSHAQRSARDLPVAVAAFIDERKISVAERAYSAPLEAIPGDSIISRLIAQNVRHPMLSNVYGELLTHGRGNEIYVRECPQFAGSRLQDLVTQFPRAILLGVARRNNGRMEPVLNPPDGFLVEAEDRLVLLARHYDHTTPDASRGRQAMERPSRTEPPIVEVSTRRVLILGWNHKVPALLAEFDGYATESFAIDIASLRPPDERVVLTERRGTRLARVAVNHILADSTTLTDMQRIDPASYDAVVLVGTDRLESGEEADARTIVNYLMLREIVGDARRPHVIVELLDPGNASLFKRRRSEVLVSPLILSHMVAQVVLRHELRAVFDELFGPGGPEIFLHPPAPYGLEGQDASFADIQQAAAARGEIALGVRIEHDMAQSTHGFHLNPPRSQRWTLSPDDDVIVLTTYGLE